MATLLHGDAVPWAVLEERYRPLLELVRTLLGVVPSCDRYLEIWPPAFRTYNILVPNFLNLPFSVLGIRSAPAEVVGLGMYVTSRTAECSYCTAHACSFALRRGASPDTVARALLPEAGGLTSGELATVAVARSLGRIPCELTALERERLIAAYGSADAEWIVLGIAMMGFLNKFMNAVGVELEQPVMSEVMSTLGPDWSTGNAGAALDPTAPPSHAPLADSLRTKLRLLPLVPAALRQDLRWQRGVPSSWPKVGRYLRDRVGHDFPVLSHLQHKRAIRSIASMLAQNLDPTTTAIGLEQKILTGLVFAHTIGDDALGDDLRALARHHDIDRGDVDAVVRFVRTGDLPAPDRPGSAPLLLLARAISPSPVAVDHDIVATCRGAGLDSQVIVELVTWFAVLQMLHRLTCFFPEH